MHSTQAPHPAAASLPEWARGVAGPAGDGLCMLARDWRKVSPARQAGICKNGILIQPKLDGVRALALPDGRLVSRFGNELRGARRIADAIKAWRARAGAFWSDVALDGEIWAPGMALGGIAGQARGFDDADERLGFYPFDWFCSHHQCSFGAFDRQQKLSEAFGGRAVHHTYIKRARPHHVIDACAHIVSEGYEGIMIRPADAHYRIGRNSGLFKLKPTEDREGTIIGVHYGLITRGIVALTVRLEGGAEITAQVPHPDLIEGRGAAALIGLTCTFRHAPGEPNRNARILAIHPASGRL